MSAISTVSRLFSRTDEEAMCRVKEHDDHHEFARLLKRWEEPIQRLCTRMTGDGDRGEDLKQEVFLRLFAKRKAYQPTGRFSTFLWRIALNRCYDELRRQQRRREFLAGGEENQATDPAGDAAAEGPGPDLEAASLEEGQLVRQAVLQLPDIYRTVIVLRHYEDMKLARIAEILEIPEGTVNSRMAEALARLCRILEPKLKGLPVAEGTDRSGCLPAGTGIENPASSPRKWPQERKEPRLPRPSPPLEERDKQSEVCWLPEATESIRAGPPG